MRKSILYLLILLSCAQVGLAQCPKLIWADEFEGTSLDLQKWTHQTGGNGWGNNELQNYRPENTTVSNGLLKITAKRETIGTNAYSSSRIRSINKGDFTYGRMEARMRLPYGQGIWPAFWMMPTDDRYGTWPKSGEIDIMEHIGRETKNIYGTIHFGPDWPNNKSSGGKYEAYQEDFYQSFHVFAVEWEPNEIRWYVDDYLYSTKRNTDISPERWPFDQRFHFILNVAVGGNWPGSPDGTTIFPQVMEVDYVRVYDLRTQSLSGPRSVPNKAPLTVYNLHGANNATSITWTVPSGAEIISGQGTATLSVKWGSSSGTLNARVETPCGTKELSVFVRVEPGLAKERALENFDDASPLRLTQSSGVLSDNFANPNKTGVNTSELVGKYVRNGSAQYDIIVYEGAPINDLSSFLNKERKFYLDVYTDAPIGTEILFQAENSTRAQQNYPVGRHSRYQAFTTKRNEWERLELNYLDRPDAGTASTAVNRYVLLFRPNTFSSNTYYFDNLDAYAPVTTSVRESWIDASKVLALSPNPGNQVLRIENIDQQAFTQINLLSLDGRILRSSSQHLAPRSTWEWSLQELPTGSYWVQVTREDGKVAVQKWLKIE